MAPAEAMTALKSAVLAFHQKPVMAKAQLSSAVPAAAKTPGVVVNIKATRPFARPRMVPQGGSRVAVAAAR